MDNILPTQCVRCRSFVYTRLDRCVAMHSCEPVATQPEPLMLPKISKFDRDWIHCGGDPTEVYSADDLEIYEAIKAKEEKDDETTQRTM